MGVVMNIIIPPAALEAGARVLHDHAEIFDDLPWDDLSDADQAAYIDEARATCLAMLDAWPGMHLGAPWVIGVPNATSIILPLPPQEDSDAKR